MRFQFPVPWLSHFPGVMSVYRQIPVSNQNLKPPLLFLLISRLVGP